MLYEEDYDITWARLSEEKEGKRSSLDLLFSPRDARHVPRKEEKKRNALRYANDEIERGILSSAHSAL